jgi:CBS domain-containing protein
MLARELMTRNPACVTAGQTIRDAAAEMERCDCGCLPVVEEGNGGKVVGVVTDRDIAMRAVAKGRGPETRVEDVMSTGPRCCCDEDDVEIVKRIMAEEQVRRVPVLDRSGRSVGMISQADLARAAERQKLPEHDVARIMEQVSQPTAH